eukprot:m.83690 g.83690  ORF g.83690 m.83690 type:complete len:183 (+) comp8312_c1_seq1:151-699(+)
MADPAELHRLCEDRKKKACGLAPFVQFMLQAMERAGCAVDVDTHLICEPCQENLEGAMDAESNEIVLCENTLYSEKHLARVLTHELVHAFDACRGKVDFGNLAHLACTEIRAASLSGDCFMSNEWFNRLNFGLSKHHQKCVKRRAMRSIVAVKGISEEEAYKAIDSVFDVCYADTAPFDRIP